MILTNSQNNIERSAIDASLKHSDYDVLASKGDTHQFNKKFGPLVTYCPADNLIYYIGYEHDPTGEVHIDTEIKRRTVEEDFEDSSIFKHNIKRYGDVFLDPRASHDSAFKGSARFSGAGDYLAIVVDENYTPGSAHNPWPFPEVFGSNSGASSSRFSPSTGRGLYDDGDLTVEFWIKPEGLDGKYQYQTIISNGANDTNGPTGPDEIKTNFEISIGAEGGAWTKGMVYVKSEGPKLADDSDTVGYVFAAGIDNGAYMGVQSFSVDSTGDLALADFLLEGTPNNIWAVSGDENYIYVAAGDEGLQVMSADSYGNLALEDTDDPQGSSTHDRYAQGVATGVFHDKQMVFTVNRSSGTDVGIHSFEVDSNGDLTYLSTWDNSGYDTGISVWAGEIGGNSFVVAKTYDSHPSFLGGKLRVFTVDSSGVLTHASTFHEHWEGGPYSTINFAVSQVWSDGTFLFASGGRNDTTCTDSNCTAEPGGGVASFSVNSAGSIAYIDNAGDPNCNYDYYARGVWGDGVNVYVANGSCGVSSFSVDSSGNVDYVDTGNPNYTNALNGTWHEGVTASSNFVFTSSYYLANQAGGDPWSIGALISYQVDSLGNLTEQDTFTDTGNVTWGAGGLFYQTKRNPNTQLGLKSTTILQEGTWHHIAVVKKNDRVDLYIDGTSEDNQLWSSLHWSDNWGGTDPVYIGVQAQYRHAGGVTGMRGRQGEEWDAHWYTEWLKGNSTELLILYGFFNGYINEFRTSYEAKYITDFDVTELVPFESNDSYVDMSNVKILIQAPYGGSSTAITDLMGHTLNTDFGSAQISDNTQRSWSVPELDGTTSSAIHFDDPGSHTVAGFWTTLTRGDVDDHWQQYGKQYGNYYPRVTIDFWFKQIDQLIDSEDLGISHDVIVGQGPQFYLSRGWNVAVENDGKVSLNIYDSPWRDCTRCGVNEPALPQYFHIYSNISVGDGEWHHIAVMAAGHKTYLHGSEIRGTGGATYNEPLVWDWQLWVDGKIQGAHTGANNKMKKGAPESEGGSSYTDEWQERLVWGSGYCGEGTDTEFYGTKTCYAGNFYMESFRHTTSVEGTSPAGSESPSVFKLSNKTGWFTPPERGKLSTEAGISTSLLLHFDSGEETEEETIITVEDGGYGLCTFNPLTLDTETVLKFDKSLPDPPSPLVAIVPGPQYKDVDHGQTDALADGCGDKWKQDRTYNIPRDIIYSARDNCLWLLFNHHEQFYEALLRCNPVDEDYTGVDGYTEQYFYSRNKFVLYKYDIKNREFTVAEYVGGDPVYHKTLWSIGWTDDFFNSGWLDVALMKEVKGLNNKYFHYPDFLRSMFTSLSINPWSGEVVALHSEKGWGNVYKNQNDWSYVEGDAKGNPEMQVASVEDVETGVGANHGHWPHSTQKHLHIGTSDTDAIWGMDKHGESWHFTPKLNDGSGASIPDADFSSNNCMIYTEPTGTISEGAWSFGPCPDDPTETCNTPTMISRAVVTGGYPKKLIFCPSTGSHYIPSKARDAWFDFIYEGVGDGRKQLSDNYLLLTIDTESSIEDGIYIPSEDKMLYLTYAGGVPGLIYVNPCKPEHAQAGQVPLAIEHCESNNIIYHRLDIASDINGAQSLVYCPSNDRIYILGEGVILKVRPYNLSTEETYSAPTGPDIKSGLGIKTFIPVYSHVNDVIYYMSNDSSRESFCFKPNY